MSLQAINPNACVSPPAIHPTFNPQHDQKSRPMASVDQTPRATLASHRRAVGPNCFFWSQPEKEVLPALSNPRPYPPPYFLEPWMYP